MLNADDVRSIISDISFVSKLYYVEESGLDICGKVQILFDGLSSALDFEFQILPQYPLKNHDSESISFYNSELISYNHVMENGSICIHTVHHINPRGKLIIDFNSLREWIVKYYIKKSSDSNYEHIIVPDCLINNRHYSYTFTDVNHTFKKGDFGEVNTISLNNGVYRGKEIQNHLVQRFSLADGAYVSCKWSSYYAANGQSLGFYYFIESSPAKHEKFIFKNWQDFKSLLSVKFLNKLHKFEKQNIVKHKGTIAPLFIGYSTINGEIHWQTALLEIGDFPLEGIPKIRDGRKTGYWDSEFEDKTITWALTRNASYHYFFGRGALRDEITNSKILIIGVGAVGSMLAKTLVRGGAKHVDIADYDVKEPENICRSEYLFSSGLTGKVQELSQILTSISPFVEVNIFNNECFESIIKISHKYPEGNQIFIDNLNEYDIIFDCSTDNDLMYILDSLELECDVINLSITNHAHTLVCAFNPNIYQFVNTQFSEILENNLTDLYEPTGCWSPTFKASYNDINLLVQLAIKHINKLYESNRKKNNFVVKVDENDGLVTRVQEY